MDPEVFLLNLSENLSVKSVGEFKNYEFVSEVAYGKIKLLTVVESLQGIFTSEDVSKRERGIEFLSWVLSQLPPDLLNENEVAVLANFYCNCLTGHHNLLPPTIEGILAIVKMRNISKEDIIKIFVNLFHNVNCRSQLQADRYNIFKIFRHAVENYLKYLEALGPDFVCGILSFIDAESDPLCLITIFNFLPDFIQNFQLGHLNEELFEVLSGYFPIDFNSAGDNEITREDLSEALIRCLSANDYFASQSIPMIFDKLDSTHKEAKLDCYKLLSESCKTLKVKSLENQLNKLWEIFQKDILPGKDQQIREAGLSALSHVVALLSKEEENRTVLLTFLGDVLTTAKSLLNRVTENMFQEAMRVLMAVSASSKIAATQVLCHLKAYYKVEFTRTSMERKIILSSLLPFLKCCNEYGFSGSRNPEESDSFRDLINLYLNSATFADFEIRKLAFAGIAEIVDNLTEEFGKKLFEIVVENIKTKEDIKTSGELLKVLRKLAENRAAEFHGIFSKDFQTPSFEVEHLSRYLWSLSLIADLPDFTNFVVPVFMDIITNSHHHVIGMESLLNACRFSKKELKVEFFKTIYTTHGIIERLIIWWSECKSEDFVREKCLIISEIIALVVRYQLVQDQQALVDKYAGLFLEESPPLNGAGDFCSFKNNLSEASVEEMKMIVILESILGSVRPEITISSILTIREKLTYVALKSPDSTVRLSSSRLLASFVNKLNEVLALDLLTRTSEDITAQLKESPESELRLNCAVLFTWLTKGVVLRGSQLFEEWIFKWFDLLGEKNLGEAVADGFRTVVEEDDLYLTVESHSNVSVLHLQRLFEYFPKFLKMYETSDDTVKMNYLQASVWLLHKLPNHLIQTKIDKVVILLVRCLSLKKPEVLLATLKILLGLLEIREITLRDYIGSFVPKLLQLAKFEGYMKIRMMALKCLYYYGFYPMSYLLPVQKQVTKGLEVCLDDKKRFVRNEAAKTRCRWFLIGAPGENILDS